MRTIISVWETQKMNETKYRNFLSNCSIIYNISTVLLLYIVTNIVPSLDNRYELVKEPLLTSELLVTILSVWSLTCLSLLLYLEKKLTFKAGSILKSAGLVFCTAILYHLIAVLYGAPFFESSAETFHFALLLSCVTALPLCIIFGPADAIYQVFNFKKSDTSLEGMVRLTTYCSLLGAWVGAFPIPLDWDRPWQEWPRSCMIGTLIGYTTGHLISAVHSICQVYFNRITSKIT